MHAENALSTTHHELPDGTEQELDGTFDSHWHSRKKKNGQLQVIVPHIVAEFGGGITMCNTDPPITTIELALELKAEVQSEVPPGEEFDAHFTYYLTDDADANVIIEGYRRGAWIACKYMPHLGSTKTGKALSNFRNGYPIYERMEEAGVPLLLHGETVGDEIDPFDAPKIFIKQEMPELRKRFPRLPVCLEHIPDGDSADYVAEAERNGEPTYATLTPQHFLYSRKRLFQRGCKSDGTFKRGVMPSFVCWPLLQRASTDLFKIQREVKRGNTHIGLGTDRALHDWPAKACEDGCGGCYFGNLNLPAYARGFELIGASEHFQNFACRNIPCGFYRLPPGKKRVRLIKCATSPSRMPDSFGDGRFIPTLHGETIPWRVEVIRG